MTKEELWKVYQEKNPAFKKDQVTFTQAGLYHFFCKTWEEAYHRGELTTYEDEPKSSAMPNAEAIKQFFPWL